MDTGVDDGGATSSVGDRGVLTIRVGIKEEIELSRTPPGDAATAEANAADIEGVDDSSGSSIHAEDETSTSFPGGLVNLSLLPSFQHHVLLDIWRNKSRGFLKCADPSSSKPGKEKAGRCPNLKRGHHSYNPQFWEEWDNHLIAKERHGENANHLWQVASGFLKWFQSVSYPFAENPKHVSEVDEEDESTLALDVVLRFRSMQRANITLENAIAMADAILTLLSGVQDEE
ncbi:hypothetical protein Syun_031822 [Stephania yunnanensis]|uniref:Uncharacterized protein n=1 Tax=Stephania yunnanensis TaxID=152371 RepID=A0AAP0HFB0_9MAGN